jgi:hypothetical protein
MLAEDFQPFFALFIIAAVAITEGNNDGIEDVAGSIGKETI